MFVVLNFLYLGAILQNDFEFCMHVFLSTILFFGKTLFYIMIDKILPVIRTL